MRIVQLTDSYIEQTKDFMQLCWNDTYRNILEQGFINRFLEQAYSTERLKIRLKLPFYLVLEEENIVGMANFSYPNENGEVNLYAIYVHPQYKGVGIGSRLLNEGIQNLQPTKILLEVEKENLQAIKFYENKKFVKIEEFKEELFGYELNTIRMKKDVQ